MLKMLIHPHSFHASAVHQQHLQSNTRRKPLQSTVAITAISTTHQNFPVMTPTVIGGKKTPAGVQKEKKIATEVRSRLRGLNEPPRLDIQEEGRN
jgi:hypothetical protein